MRTYVTTAIPYVNGDPHLGHALESIQADVLARHRRLRGEEVRLLSGTDDNALKNVDAARAAGVPVRELVDRKAARFAGLAGPLELSYDDFIQTSSDPRHRPGVERLWRACAERGDLELRDYTGLYCAGCEAFLDGSELLDGLCPEHAAPPERVVEQNWFFRLSRYQQPLLELLESGRLRIEPEHRRNEVLAFVRAGLADLSVSRRSERAGGWGIPVPGDASQVVYVWFDALANYITALGYGEPGADYDRWWRTSDERLHVIGKGIVRFHAVYWPAILLSAGEPLPSAILVHDYLTVDGRKLSKSLGNAIDPERLAAAYGVDAVRWWCLRDVPRRGDADFREELLAARANELADGLGNLIARTLALVARSRPDGVRPASSGLEETAALDAARDRLPTAIDAALAAFDLRSAAGALWELVGETNRVVAATRPWELARAERAGDAAAGEQLDAALASVLAACQVVARELRPLLPGAAERVSRALATRDVEGARRLFPKYVSARGGA